MFTEFKFSPEVIASEASAVAASVAEHQASTDPAAYAAETIAMRLRQRPGSYVQFGPYWWSVKAALRASGFDFGRQTDDVLKAEYGGAFPAYGVLVAGELFRDHYLANYFDGTAMFDLGSEGEESVTIMDDDMEARRLATESPMKAIDWSSEAEDDGAMPTLDSASRSGAGIPIVVGIEYDAELWRVTAYAQSTELAHGAVGGWVSSGRVGRAIDRAKDAGGALLDSAEPVALHVDIAGRRIFEAG